MVIGFQDLVVGDEPCTYESVCNALSTSATSNLLWSKLIDLSRTLGVAEDWNQMTTPWLLNKNKPPDSIFIEMLGKWRAQTGQKATLEALIFALEFNGLHTSADDLKNQFYGSNICFKMEHITDSTTWNDLSENLALEIRKKVVIFQGKQVKLDECVDDHSLSKMDSTLLTELSNDKSPILINNQVPEGLSYYIERRLKMRNKLDKEIFQNNSDDIILVQGITRMKLASLVESTTDLSGNQIPRHKITARFLVLEYEDDFDRICKIATEPVHWIKFKNESYYWVKSSGPVKSLQKYLHVAQDSFHEAKLVTGKDKVILISDSPGMGKSMLLSNIANRIQKERPTTVVRFIVLKEFLELLGNQTISIGSIISALTENSSKFPLGRELVKRSLTENGVLVFDGFDEVLLHQIDSAKQILQSVVVNLKSARVFVSTRPQFLEELENMFHVLGQIINPFEENDKINLLKLHWNSNGHDTGVLHDFAKSCLKRLEFNMTNFEDYIAGIPLQCRMLAEIYEDEAKKSTKEDYNVDGMDWEPISLSSSFEIYEKFTFVKFAKLVSGFGESDLLALCRQDWNFCTHSEEIETQFTAIINAHMHFALKLMFPVYTDLFPFPAGSNIISPKTLTQLGILQANDSGEIRFVHRTFAEYFLASFVVKQFSNNGATRKFILSDVLKTTPVHEKIELPSRGNGSIPIDIKSFKFCYPVIAYFIDGFSKKMFHGKHQLDTILTPMDLFAYSHCSSIFYASAYHRYCYLLPYLYKILKEGNYPAIIKRNTYAVNVKEIAELLLIVGKYATVYMMKIFCQRIDITDMQFTKLIDFSHDTLETSKDVGYGSESSIGSGGYEAFIITPLHVAVQRGHYNMVEYLLSIYGSKVVEQKFVLHFCVFASLRDSKDVISQKIKIIKLLTTKSNHFLDEQLADNLTPLLQKNVHPELVEYLIQEGADVNYVDRVENSVLHRMSENFLTPKSYHQIVQSLNGNDFHLFNTSNLEKRTPLHLALKNTELLEETVGVFMSNAFNAASSDGYSVLMHAIAGRRSDRLLRQLIYFGANWKHINKKNENMLHVSVTSRNFSALRYFLEHHELELNFLNSDLMTPLHVAVLRLSETNEIIQQLLIDSGANMNVISDDYRMSPFIQAFTVGEGLSLNIIKLMEVRGFVISNKLASEALQAAFQNKKIIPDGEFIKVLEYLISKRGREEQPTSWSPWVKVKEKVQDIIEHTKLDSSLMSAIKKHSLLSEDEMLQINQTTESKSRLYDILQQSKYSFEILCLSLLQCKQLFPYYLLKKCVESELQSSINCPTPIRDSNMPFSSSPYQFDLSQSDRDESPFPNNRGNFVRCHPNFSKFMDSADTLLIIETLFPEVSYKRIADTSHVPVSELLKELPMQQNISRDVLYIVYIKNMELILKARENEKCKMILLTEENKELLENKLGNQKGLQIYRDHMKWSDLSSTFQEKMMNSCDIMQKICNKSLQHLLCDDILFRLIQNPSKGTLANKLSPHIKYYIDRKIVSRNVVSKQDFGSKEKYQKFVSMIETEYSESEFLEMLERNERKGEEQKRFPVCISDGPGMGKSTLLAHFGRKLENKFVLMVETRSYLQCIKYTSSPYSCNNVIDALCKAMSCGDVAQKIVLELLKFKVEIEIMFDGLDESPEDLESMFHSFRMICTAFPSVRLWITTRPHLLNNLENELGVFGYGLSPFDLKDQQNFLVKYWQHESTNSNLNGESLKLFARECLEQLEKFVGSRMNSALSVPFLCQLAAEFYKNEANLYATNKSGFNNCLPCIEYESVAALYKHFVSKIFEKYINKYQMGEKVTTEDLINVHISHSASLLFPRRICELKSNLDHNEMLENSEILKVGLLKSADVGDTPQFITSCFADYFAAQFAAKFLLNDKSGFASVSFLIEEILKSKTIDIEIFPHNPDYFHTKDAARFCHATICYFFDNIIDVNLKIENLVEVLGARKFLVGQIALACVYHDSFNLFRTLNKTDAFRLFKKDIYKPSSLFVLVSYSRLSFIDYFLKKFNRVRGIDLLTVVLYDDHVDLNLLHVAAHKGRYKIFEYLLSRGNFLEWINDSAKTLLIHLCVAFSDADDYKVVSNKLQIIRAIQEVRKDIFKERDHENRNVISCRKIHHSILKECKKFSDI